MTLLVFGLSAVSWLAIIVLVLLLFLFAGRLGR